MVEVKLKNVSVKSGDRFRNNQNYIMNFWKKDRIDENSIIDDIKDLIISKYSNRIVLNKSSQIEIMDVSPVSKNEHLYNIHSVLPILHQIAKCIDDAIENNEDNDKISEVVELMKCIAEDNWMFVRN